MITDEEIYAIANESGLGCWLDETTKEFLWYDGDASDAIDKAYQLGRQHQRESDAALKDSDIELALRTGQTGVAFSFKMYQEAIHNNTGELR